MHLVPADAGGQDLVVLVSGWRQAARLTVPANLKTHVVFVEPDTFDPQGERRPSAAGEELLSGPARRPCCRCSEAQVNSVSLARRKRRSSA
jgi:hypothetical protein